MKKNNIRDILEELKKREPIFHRPEFGKNRADFENMLVADYWEIGASGKRYDREFCIDTMVKRYEDTEYLKNDIWETKDFECREISPECYLLTYTLIWVEFHDMRNISSASHFICTNNANCTQKNKYP